MKKLLQKIALIFILAIAGINNASATTYTFIGGSLPDPTDYDDFMNWDLISGKPYTNTVLSPGDIVNITAPCNIINTLTGMFGFPIYNYNIPSGATINISAPTTINTASNFSLNGTINIDPSKSLIVTGGLIVSGDMIMGLGTINNNGTLTFNGIALNSGIINNNDTINVNNVATLYNIGSNNLITNNTSSTIINNGLIYNGGINPLTALFEIGKITNVGTFINYSGSKINNSGTFTNNSGGVIIDTATFTNLDGSTVTNNSGATFTNYGPFNLGADTSTLMSTLTNHGTFTNNGSIDIYQNCSFTNDSISTNDGDITAHLDINNSLIGGRLINTNNHTFTNNSNITFEGDPLNLPYESSLFNIGTINNWGTINNNTSKTDFNSDSLINYGTINYGNGAGSTIYGYLYNNGTIQIDPLLPPPPPVTIVDGIHVSITGVFDNSKVINAFVPITNAGTVNDSSQIGVLINGGTLNNYKGTIDYLNSNPYDASIPIPANSITNVKDTLTIVSQLDFNSTSTTNMSITSLTVFNAILGLPGAAIDEDGALNITSYTPAATHTFPIIKGTVMGTFATVKVNGVSVTAPGSDWSIIYYPDSTVLKYTKTSPQAISLLQFTATKNASFVALNWATIVEKNTDRFEIEKSTDAENFSTIGEVKAVGNSTTQQNYSFTDNAIIANTVYYRLKMIDMDNKFTYSTIAIITDNDTKLLVENTVVHNFVNIISAKNIVSQLYNMQGDCIKNMNLQQGENSIDMTSLTPGIYVIKTKFNSVKIIKTN